MNIVKGVGRIPASLALGLIVIYQKLVSPAFGANCRFQPTCSQYTKVAITRFGLIRGSWLGLRRLGRCHPLRPGGFDPVPEHWAG
ncbi:MAG: membrane protein insertion efficiency factor YidD [Actinomycetota bacterium]